MGIQIKILFAILVYGSCSLASVCLAQKHLTSQLNVRTVTDEADAVLAILTKRTYKSRRVGDPIGVLVYALRKKS